MFLLLAGAAALYFILGEPREGSIMLNICYFCSYHNFHSGMENRKNYGCTKRFDFTSGYCNEEW